MRDNITPTIIVDTREPDIAVHPWTSHFQQAGCQVVREGLETGDICLAGNLDIAVERKTPSDLLGVMVSGRERFEKELARARHLSAFCVVVSGSIQDCLDVRRGFSETAFVGTLSAWSRRYSHPIIFAGNDTLAADFTLRFLTQPVREAKKLLTEVEKAKTPCISQPTTNLQS